MKKSKDKSLVRVFMIVMFFVFILLFTYSSLNLKNIDYGYRMHELILREKALKEKVDKLKAQKASLLNLKRVERIVKKKLNYQYPRKDQFVKVFENK